MAATYSLKFAEEIFPFQKEVEIYHRNKNGNGESQFFVFLDEKLYSYKYENLKWHRKLLLDNTFKNKVLHFPTILENEDSIMMLKTKNGIDFYQYKDNKFNLLSRSNDFVENIFDDEVFRWNEPGNIIKCGHFYDDKNLIGIFTKHQLHGLNFYAVMKDNFITGDYPIWPLTELDLSLLGNTSNSNFFLANLENKGQENIIVRNRSGMNVYEFNQSYDLQHLLQVPSSSKISDTEENIFFPRLTGQSLKDIVVFNSSGLFIYQYDMKQKNYNFIHYNPLFDKKTGWDDKHIDTVRFKDINFDGREEMFFTGPRGMDVLTFDNYTLQWRSVLDVSQTAISERHNNFLEIGPVESVDSESAIVFAKDENELHWAKFGRAEKQDDDDFENELSVGQPSNTTSVIPEFIKLDIADVEKPHILLRDQLDFSSILKGVDKDTGKANFKVPLIGLPNFANNEKINLFYNGNSKDANILGVGWSFPVSLIMMDHQGSIFTENERYFLLLEDFPQQLLLDSDRSTDSVKFFKTSEEEEETKIQIVYYKSEERWEIDFRGVKQIYGRRQNSTEDSVSLDLSWKFWRGPGSSLSGQVELVNAWFLSEVRGGKTSATYYTYDINNVLIPGSNKRYTREFYLKAINDLEGNKIVFKYLDKDLDEYNLPPLIDENGFYNARKVQTRYLAGYSLTTYNYRQEIRFNYRVEDGKRILTEIEQRNDPTNRPVLQFFYNKIMDSHQLERVVLPTGVEVEFSYETVENALDDMDNINLICDVSSSYRVDYGQDFVLISYINKLHHVALRMYDRELKTEMYSSLSPTESSRFPFLGERSVRYYEIKILNNALVFTFEYESSKALCLLDKEKDKWSLNPKYFNYDKDAIIKVGNDFIAVLDARKAFLEIIVWDKKSKEWIKEEIETLSRTESTDLLLQVSGKVFLIYNDEFVIVGYRNMKNKWQSKVIITFPGVIGNIRRILDKFNLENDTYNVLFNLMKNNAFQISNNFIAFNRWNIQGTKSYSDIELFSLNSKYEVSHQQSHMVMQDDLIEFSEEIDLVDEKKAKSYLTLAYEKDGEQFKIKIKDMRGAILDEIKEFCNKKYPEVENCVSETKKSAEKEGLEAVQKLFILNMQKYLVYLQSSYMVCGETHLIFTGSNWKVDTQIGRKLESEEWSVPIDDQYLLAKDNAESSIKLFNRGTNRRQKGNLILDLEVKNVTQISNKYPIYLAYQKENQEVNVAFYEFFNANVKKVFTLPRGETISVMSDHTTLVTHADSIGDDENIILYFRHFLGMKSKLPNAVVKKLTVNFDREYKRVTGYDYDQSSVKAAGDIVFYEKTVMIPGNDRSSSGYVEESTNITGNYNIINNIYDASGKLIKTIRAESVNNNNKTITEENAVLKSTVLDITGHLQVAQFYPYEMQDEEVSYYGFEDYEVNKIGGANSTKRWSFNETNIVKQEFSLTGENYLRLSQSRLLGEFQPCNQNQHYIASCWIRTKGKGLEIGKIAPYLKAVVYAQDNREINGYFSEVKFQYDDWSYLEVVIDLFYAKEVFENLLSNSSSSYGAKDSKLGVTESGTAISSKNSKVKVEPFKIIVTVSPGISSTVDVDHIRFSPLNSNFKAATYNFKTKKIKEIINANGLIKRYLYNEYQDRIVSINESGEIEKLSIYTKASSIGRMASLKSEIEILPNQGFYEDFNPYSFRKRWIIDNDERWKISPGELHHLSNQFDQLKLSNMRNFDSYGMRLHFVLQSKLSIIKFNDVLQLERRGDSAVIKFLEKRRPIPTDGEILLIVENNRLMVWIDGGLYFDEGELDKSLLDLEMYGNTKISDMLVFNDLSIRITYLNALNEKVQEINLEASTSAIVTEFLYDEFGRHCITTKPTRLQRAANQSVVAHYSNFVTNKNPLSAHSIWKINRILGEFESLDPYSYYQVTYTDNPLNEKSGIGLPGQEFSVSGLYAKRFSSSTRNKYINQLYPTDLNYRYIVEHKLGDVEDIKVFNGKNNTVAWLKDVPGRMSVLATYEYNDDGKLIKTLSPLYHKKAGTLTNIDSSSSENNESENDEENSLSVETSYDKKGNVIAQTTPDSGKIEYLYNDAGLKKFAIYYSSYNNTVVENVVYFNYDQLGRLINTGKLISPLEKEKLLNLPLSKNNTEEYQVFYHSNLEREPTLRGRLKRSVTNNDGASFIEESVLNGDKKVLSKRIFVLNENSDEPLIITTNKKYKAGKLKEIEYPVNVQGKPFKITYSYDKLGRIKAIGIPSKNNLFVEFAHNSVGHIITEHHLPDQLNINFKRNYSYNSASFLTKLEDKYLTENVYYTEGSYGGYGYGDGIVSRTEFNATWHDFADASKLHLNEKSFVSHYATSEESKLCFDKLKEAGYINQYNRQAKIYYPSLELDLPLVCSTGVNARLIQNILGRNGFPSIYGHLYDYGAYEELVRAKYFVGEDSPAPLQPSTFAEIIPKINATTSYDIWDKLKENGYLIEHSGLFKPQGKRGANFVRSTLCEDLKAVKESYQYYCEQLKNALLFFFSKKLDLPLFKENLKRVIFKWLGEVRDANKIEKVAKAIVEMLERKGYLKNPLAEKFSESLQQYQSIIPEIIDVLFQYFGKALGEAEFDVEAYDIDENGNHKHYYSGFDRYKLKYRNNSNQIESVDFNSIASFLPMQSFSMKHDNRGNVVQALHKGIKNITYHSVSNCVTSIELLDGKKLIFHYDAQGERVLKRVLDATGAVKREVHYVRDEFGRSLVERELTWSSPNLPPNVLVTAYIYGPKGLIGFIRRDEYYSVITDHEGSVRLVVKDGEVVAAYDYLPYGNLMRQYGVNSETHISYRYTGQEWDEEIDLYNYHARLYDPSLGRFYQHDPKMQYFSPYKYAGNSPVSMIDPNGEEAILLLVLIIAGAYLGGAAASGSWNPLKWDFSNWKVWLGIFLGGLTGYLAPGALTSSIAAFTSLEISYEAAVAITVAIGSVGAYLGMAKANNEWDPSKWDFSSPATWNGIFTGFLMMAGAPGIINNSVNFFSSLSSVYTRGLFVLSGLTVGASAIAFKLAGKKLDFTKPEVYYEILGGFLTGFSIVLFVKGNFRIFIDNIHSYNIDIEMVDIPTDYYLENFTIGGFLKAFVSTVLNDGEIEFALTSTYDSFAKEMIAYSNLRSFRSLLYKKRGLINNIEYTNIAINKVKSIAKEIVDIYKKIIKDYEFPKEFYTDNMRSRLEAGIIPNTILTIAKTIDDMVFVGFSGKAGPGFLSSFGKKEDNFHIGYPPENPKVPRIIAINDDNNINNLIGNALEDKRNIMVEINYGSYLRKKNTLKSVFDKIILSLLSPKLKSYFNNAEVVNFVEKIGDEIKINGYVQSKEHITIIILSFLLQKHNLLKKTTLFSKDLQKIKANQINKLLELEEKIVEFEQSVGLSENEIDQNQAFEEKKKMLISRLKVLREMKDQIYSDVSALNEELSEKVTFVWEDYLKHYLNEFTHWTPTIFLEPQVVTYLMRNRLDIPSQMGAKYTLDDLQYLESEKIMRKRYISEAEPVGRCLDCEETTRNVTNILIDPEWENVIATERTKWLDTKTTEGYCSKGFNFFMPYNQVKSENMCHKIIKAKTGDLRKKRFAIDRQQLISDVIDSSDDIISENYENKSNHIDDKKSVNNRSEKPTNFTNNLFGWMRTSVNKLFDSKKILPEKSSNSSVLKKIADSNNNLTAVTAIVDVNSTLLLLDTVIRKVTGQKFISTSNDNATLLESRGYSLDIGSAFEKTMKYAASKSGISMHRFNIHYIEVQDKVIDKIMTGKLDEIAEILISHAEKACPHRETGCPGKLSPKKFEKFIDVFSKRIDIELNEIMLKNKRIKGM